MSFASVFVASVTRSAAFAGAVTAAAGRIAVRPRREGRIVSGTSVQQ